MTYCQDFQDVNEEPEEETQGFGDMMSEMASQPDFWSGIIGGILVGEAIEKIIAYGIVGQIMKKQVAKAGLKAATKELTQQLGEEMGTKIAKELAEELGERTGKKAMKEALKKVSKEVAENTAKIVAKKAAAASAKAASGPVGWALLIVDIVSVVLDAAEMTCMMSMDQDPQVQKQRCKNVRGYMLLLQNSLLSEMQKSSLIAGLVQQQQISPENAQLCEKELGKHSVIELQAFFDEFTPMPAIIYFNSFNQIVDGESHLRPEVTADIMLIQFGEMGLKQRQIDEVRKRIDVGETIDTILPDYVEILFDETPAQIENTINESEVAKTSGERGDVAEYVAKPPYEDIEVTKKYVNKKVKIPDPPDPPKPKSSTGMIFAGSTLLGLGLIFLIIAFKIPNNMRIYAFGVAGTCIVIGIILLSVSSTESFEDAPRQHAALAKIKLTPTEFQLSMVNTYRKHMLKQLDPAAFENGKESERLKWNFDTQGFLEDADLGGIGQIANAVANGYTFKEKGCNDASIIDFNKNGSAAYTTEQIHELTTTGKKMSGTHKYLVFDKSVQSATIKSDDITVNEDGTLTSSKSGKDTLKNLKYRSSSDDTYILPNRETSAVPIIDSQNLSTNQKITLIDATGEMHEIECGENTKSDEFKLPCFELSANKTCKFGNSGHKNLVEAPQQLPDNMYVFKKFFMIGSKFIRNGDDPAISYDPATGSAKISKAYCDAKEVNADIGQKNIKSEPKDEIGRASCRERV